jgi:branched-chain amino acid aminotransferase
LLSTGIQYGHLAFDGMKWYRRKDGGVQFFRPHENARRFQESCRRVMMPTITIERFIDAICQTVVANSEYVPPHETKATLYVRPFMIGIGSNLVLAPSKRYLFGVITQPVGLFFKTGLTPSNFLISEYDRAAHKGTGDVKVGGNYAASFFPNDIAKSQGFTDCLYLDPLTHTKIDEGGAANFFAITKDGIFVTPKSPSILPSITKRSLLDIAKTYLNLEVVECDIYINRIDELAEAATCGTAAIITPIGGIEYRGRLVTFGETHEAGPITKKLYDLLVGIQFGDIKAPEGWILNVE